MSKFGCLVLGPAGAGKTTFCTALLQHLQASRRSSFYINLDPAASNHAIPPDLDICELISLSDVMQELGLGPNGGLIYCFEYLLQNLDFLTDALEEVGEETLCIIDMPGQIELYTHVPILPNLVKQLGRNGSVNMSLCATYLLESTFVVDRAKFFAGTLSAMSAMVLLEMPHVNVLSKMDLVKGVVGRKELKRFVNVDVGLMEEEGERLEKQQRELEGTSGNADEYENDYTVFPRTPATTTEISLAEDPHDPASKTSLFSGSSFQRLNSAVAHLIDDFSMVSFLKLDSSDEDSVAAILSYVDDAIQFHEAQEPKEPRQDEEEADTGDNAYYEEAES